MSKPQRILIDIDNSTDMGLFIDYLRKFELPHKRQSVRILIIEETYEEIQALLDDNKKCEELEKQLNSECEIGYLRLEENEGLRKALEEIRAEVAKGMGSEYLSQSEYARMVYGIGIKIDELQALQGEDVCKCDLGTRLPDSKCGFCMKKIKED